MGKYLGLDFGKKRVGLALSDEGLKYSFAEETMVIKNIDETIKEIKNICQAEGVEKIIIGLPINLKGEKTAWTKKVEGFSCSLKKETGLPLDFQDERLTSKMTMSLFKEANKKRVKKAEIDATSARIILQDYLDKMNL